MIVVALIATIAVGYWIRERPQRQFALGLQEVQRQDWPAVRRRASALEKSAAYFPHAQLFWGVAEIQDEQLMYAIEDLETATQHDDTKALAWAYAGEAWFKLRNYAQAESLLLKALEGDSNRADTHRWLAALYYDTGAMEHALIHLKRTAELAPTDSRPHRLMGLINKDFEMYEPAVAAYQESLRRSPDQPGREEVLLELAESQVRARQYASGLTTLGQCNNSAERKVLEAECHFALGDGKRAKSLLGEVLRQSPRHVDALLLLGRVVMDEGNLPEAVRVLSECVASDPLNYAARFRLGQAYQRQGNQIEAARHGAIAEDIKGLRERFAQLHRQAIANPRDAEIRYQLGAVAEKLNRSDLARNWYQSALALNANHHAASAAIGQIEKVGSRNNLSDRSRDSEPTPP